MLAGEAWAEGWADSGAAQNRPASLSLLLRDDDKGSWTRSTQCRARMFDELLPTTLEIEL